MENWLNITLSLGGFAVLVSLLVNLGKKIGLVKDGYADKWHAGLQILVFILVASIDIFGLEIDLLQVDNVAGLVADLGAILLGILGMLGIGGFTYSKVRGVIPGVGFSHRPKLN